MYTFAVCLAWRDSWYCEGNLYPRCIYFVYMDLRCVRRLPQYRFTTSHSSAMSILALNTSSMLVNVPPSVPDRPDNEDLFVVPEIVFRAWPLSALDLSPMRTYNFSSTEMMASVCHFYFGQFYLSIERRRTHVLFVQILVPYLYCLPELVHDLQEILLAGFDSFDPSSQVA